jgi:hypothetical protein
MHTLRKNLSAIVRINSGMKVCASARCPKEAMKGRDKAHSLKHIFMLVGFYASRSPTMWDSNAQVH